MFKMSIKSEGGKKGSKISCGVETNTVAVTLEHWTLAAVTLESVQKTCGLRLHQRIGRSTKQVTMVGILPKILRSRTLGGIAPVEENRGKSVSNAVYQLLSEMLLLLSKSLGHYTIQKIEQARARNNVQINFSCFIFTL